MRTAVLDCGEAVQAKANGLLITGCDFLQPDDEGRITDFLVMVRPPKAAQAPGARMGDRYPDIVVAATEWSSVHG